MEFIKEFLLFLKNRKKICLIPIIILMVLFGLILIAAENSVISPFIYSLF